MIYKQGAVAIDPEGIVWQLHTFRGDGQDVRWWRLPPAVLLGFEYGGEWPRDWKEMDDVPGTVVYNPSSDWAGGPGR